MSTFENIVNLKLHSYIENENKSILKHKFILALSGGVDSIALFCCLNNLGLCFYTIHFNHNYHSKSNEVSVFIDDLTKNSSNSLSSLM